MKISLQLNRACWHRRVALPLCAMALCTAMARAQAGLPAVPTKPPSATPPTTNCTLQSKDGSGVLGLARNIGTATIAFWTDFTVTCGYTGGVQTLTVPPGPDHGPLTVQAFGAAGGKCTYGPNAPSGSYDVVAGGNGASVLTNLSVAAGTQLQVRVGGLGNGGAEYAGPGTTGAGGYNGGGQGGYSYGANIPAAGGGGASDVRIAPFDDAHRVMVAGGGGGAGGIGTTPGPTGGAGGFNGADGGIGLKDTDYSDTAHTGGYGGTQSAAGAGGDADQYYGLSHAGVAGNGSAGGSAPTDLDAGGGGGGGWFGGGAGESQTQGGGGGGSSHGAPGDSSAQFATGARSGNGQAVFQYRVYTKRVACLNISVKALARGSKEPACEQFTPQ